jgi:hypothetical protein
MAQAAKSHGAIRCARPRRHRQRRVSLLRAGNRQARRVRRRAVSDRCSPGSAADCNRCRPRLWRRRNVHCRILCGARTTIFPKRIRLCAERRGGPAGEFPARPAAGKAAHQKQDSPAPAGNHRGLQPAALTSRRGIAAVDAMAECLGRPGAPATPRTARGGARPQRHSGAHRHRGHIGARAAHVRRKPLPPAGP